MHFPKDNNQYITLLFDHFHQVVYYNKCTGSSYASTRTKKRIDKVYMKVIMLDRNLIKLIGTNIQLSPH